MKIGSAVVTVGYENESASMDIEVDDAILVEIQVTPTNPSSAKGLMQDFIATGIFSDNTNRNITNDVVWTSTDESVATISNEVGSKGKATAVNTGTVTITATMGSVSGSTDFTVTDAVLTQIQITPNPATMPVEKTLQFTATGIYSDSTRQDITTYVSWSSDNGTVAQISNAMGSKGIAYSLSSGTCYISATDPATSITQSVLLTVNNATLTAINITPVNPTLAKGLTLQFVAIGIYDNGKTYDLTNDSNLTWSSSNTNVATISNADGSRGLATASSSNTGITTISATVGSVTGQTDLTVTDAEIVAISITPSSTTVPNGLTKQFTATAVFSDSSTQDITSQVTWESSDTDVASISNADGSRGLATARSLGTVTITATHSSGKNATAQLTVSDATLQELSITPAGAVMIGFGTYQQFKATGTYSDGSNVDVTSLVTWTSSNTDVASISNVSPTNGRATSIGAGCTTIIANLSGKSANASLEVRIVTLVSIEVTPSNSSIGERQTQQMYAKGIYNDGSWQDLTSQVLWTSSNNGIAPVSNAFGSEGLVTGVTPGEATIYASRNGITGSTTINVTADQIRPTVTSAQLSGTNSVIVSFSEPLSITEATKNDNFKISLKSHLPSDECSTDNNILFNNTTSELTITGVDVLSPSVFKVNFSGTLVESTYAIVVSRAITDIASTPNALGCPNYAYFSGIDTTPPYLVSVSNTAPTQIRVQYSEPVVSDGSANAANNIGNYTLEKLGTCSNNPVITSVEKLDDETYLLLLSESVCSIDYRLTASTNILDLGVPTPNSMGSPNSLTFQGNEQLKVAYAEAISTTQVKLVFNKPVKAENNVAGSAACTGNDECAKRYKFNPSLGLISKAEVGTGNLANTVTITHSNAQAGVSYTIIVANGINGDGFDNATWGSIKSAVGEENVQAAPKDRATFMGLGSTYDEFSDGAVFEDPFVDGSTFSFAFTYAGKVYLGTNDKNNAAFRFEPDGSNSVQVLFNYSYANPTCTSADGFGYIVGNITIAPTCGINSGPRGEVGVVGFNSAFLTIGGSPYELLITGPLKNAVSDIYYTQDLDLDLDWRNAAITGGNGLNTKSVQTIYGVDNFVFIGISSDHNTNLPVFNRYTATVASGVVTLGSVCDLDGKNITRIGDPVPNGKTAGIDAILKFGSNLYIGNNGGIVRSSNYGAACGSISWTDSTPASFTGTTLVLPDSNTTDGGGLGKIRPGQRGIAKFLEYNGKLYMARNVAVDATNSRTPLRGELWVCTPSGGVCGPSDWTRIISGSETALGSTAKSISLLQSNGNGKLYVGFDDPTDGVRVYSMACTEPGASTGSSGNNILAPCNGTGSANWILQGSPGFGSTDHKYIISYASITSGSEKYLYLIIGDGVNAVKVFRQIDY